MSGSRLSIGAESLNTGVDEKTRTPTPWSHSSPPLPSPPITSPSPAQHTPATHPSISSADSTQPHRSFPDSAMHLTNVHQQKITRNYLKPSESHPAKPLFNPVPLDHSPTSTPSPRLSTSLPWTAQRLFSSSPLFFIIITYCHTQEFNTYHRAL